MRNLPRQLKTGLSPQALIFCHNSFFSLLFLHPLRHRFREASQAGILSAASRAEMADVEQIEKTFPFITCAIAFAQNVCELVFGVNILNLDLGIQIDPFKQPIRSNPVGS